MNQSELEENICKKRQARENLGQASGGGFAANWLRKWARGFTTQSQAQ